MGSVHLCHLFVFWGFILLKTCGSKTISTFAYSQLWFDKELLLVFCRILRVSLSFVKLALYIIVTCSWKCQCKNPLFGMRVEGGIYKLFIVLVTRQESGFSVMTLSVLYGTWFMYGLLKENVSCINPSLVLSFVPFSFWKIRGDNRFIKYLHLYLWIFISSYRYFDRGLHRFLVRLVCPFLKQPFMIVYSILLNCAHNKKIPNNDFLVDQTKMAFWLSPLKMQCILINLSFTFILLHKC